jgi:hypothetical protein
MRNALLAVLGTTLVTVMMAAGFEAVIRFTGIGEAGRVWYLGGNHPRNMVIGDPGLGYRLRPGFRGREINARGDFDVPLQFNSSGLREPERDYRDCASTVIGLGDSFTFGEGVAAEDGYLALLERRLNEPHQQAMCVVNAGVPGYGLHQIVGLYSRIGGQLPHRIVFLALHPEDIARLEWGFVEYQGWIVAEAALPVLQSCSDGDIFQERESFNTVFRLLYCRSAAFAWLGHRRLDGRDLNSFWPEKQSRPVIPSRGEAPDYLLAAKEQSERLGAAMVVMEVCNHDAGFERFCRTNGIRYLSVPCPKEWSFAHDPHWNATGHRAVADIVYGYLSASGLLR